MHSTSGWNENIPKITFERYADDVIVHCKSESEAQQVLEAIKERLAQCRLQLNAEKTRIVYCKDENRKATYENTSFDFLGYTYQARSVKRGKQIRNGFLPAISNKAKLRIHEEVRSWRVHLHTTSTIQEVAQYVNPKIRGWRNYYGAYYKSAMYRIRDRIEWYLTRWTQKKYKCNRRKAGWWLKLQKEKEPTLFAHWAAAW